LLGCAAFGFALSPSYWVMALFSVVAGVGNGVFHPVDYTLINRKVSSPRLGMRTVFTASPAAWAGRWHPR
jgi:MFS family permease